MGAPNERGRRFVIVLNDETSAEDITAALKQKGIAAFAIPVADDELDPNIKSRIPSPQPLSEYERLVEFNSANPNASDEQAVIDTGLSLEEPIPTKTKGDLRREELAKRVLGEGWTRSPRTERHRPRT